MSEPKKHHYLPEAYLRRWAQNRQVWRFIRPRDESYPIHAKRISPGGVGYKRELYSYPRPTNDSDKRAIEKEFFQRIDHLGAEAITKAENNAPFATLQDKVDIVQFMLSMAFRSPRQLDFITSSLKERLLKDRIFWNLGDDYFRHHGLELMTEIIASDFLIGELAKLKVYVIEIATAALGLMTSDKPLLLSNGLHHKHSFLAIPIGPNKLLMLARDKAVPESFANQKPIALVEAINDAVCVQAEELVIGNRKEDRDFVETRLQRGAEKVEPHRNPFDGLVRWKAPVVSYTLPGLPQGN